MGLHTVVLLFTRDLRLRDNPALAVAAASAERVVPLFVLDPVLADRSANRYRFLLECLEDLREALRRRGGDLVVRIGDPVAETIRVARQVLAQGVVLSADVSRYARQRQRRLERECARHRLALRLCPGVSVVPPGELTPAGGGDHYRVFTPYYRLWRRAAWRPEVAVPRRILLPEAALELPRPVPPAPPGQSPAAALGGEAAGRRQLRGWLRHVDRYADRHDELARGGTSRLSPYLRFGCLSPLEVTRAALEVALPVDNSVGNVVSEPVDNVVDSPPLRAVDNVVEKSGDGSGAEAFVRQLCWRDFYHQVAFAFPDLPTRPYRPRAVDTWRVAPDELDAWRAGRTGVPVVDAGMRQLRAEGWMHNRARMITAAYLTKELGLDWRAGGDWFASWLLDADVANNYGNWQWSAGTGNDTKPYRRFNPIRQAERFDPDGAYVRRYVPELESVAGRAVHQPWLLPGPVRAGLDYPQRLAGPAGPPAPGA